MSESPGDAQRTRFLLTNLIIITVFILTLVFLALAYPVLLAPAPTSTPTITDTRPPTLTPAAAEPTGTITPIPTQTRTQRPSHTPTITLTPLPSGTATITPSPTGPPSITPAKPLNDNALYSLRPWKPENADRLIDLLNYYPNTLSPSARGEDNRAYYQAFSYAVYAQREALLRFPDAPQANGWRWGLAFNLARLGDPLAGENYAQLIAGALNAGQTRPAELSAWFANQEKRIEFSMVELDPPPGTIGSYLLELHGPGSAYLRVLETTGAFQVETLVSGFDFVHEPQTNAILSDLNLDGDQDVAIYQSHPPDSLVALPPVVYNLAETPAELLPFSPIEADFYVGTDFRNYWAVVKDEEGRNQLSFQTRVFPACPVRIQRDFQWDGESFRFVAQSFELEPDITVQALCQYSIDHAARVWGPQSAISLMNPLLPEWPPESTEDVQFPLDARDEFRFRLGLYDALVGDFETARREMTSLAEHPTVPASRWGEPAAQFLQAYQAPQDVYRACAAAPFCLPGAAIRYLVAQMQPEDWTNALIFLKDRGVQVRSSGYFDFDSDGNAEHWFTIRHAPLERLEFWILARAPDGIEPFLIATLNSDVPTLEYLDPAFVAELQPAPVVFLDKEIAFLMLREPETRRPYIPNVALRKLYPNRFAAGFDLALKALFAGEDPEEVLDALDAAGEPYGDLPCTVDWSCDPYYYTLGLANELAGNKLDAIEQYLFLWRNYSKSPYTVMARLKLLGQAAADFTDTPTATSTGGPTSTPGTVNPTASGTPGGTEGTPTPTATRTETPEGYPGPAPTSTSPYP